MRLRIELNHKDLRNLGIGMVVEGFLRQRHTFGRGRRIWNESFTPEERTRLKKLYPLFYRWEIIKGTPDAHIFEDSTDIALVQRAAMLFGRM